MPLTSERKGNKKNTAEIKGKNIESLDWMDEPSGLGRFNYKSNFNPKIIIYRYAFHYLNVFYLNVAWK